MMYNEMKYIPIFNKQNVFMTKYFGVILFMKLLRRLSAYMVVSLHVFLVIRKINMVFPYRVYRNTPFLSDFSVSNI